MTDYQIGVGDVCLDLAQGRPVHVVEATDLTAAGWSELNNYELCENYGNSRLGASADDAVFEVVYCSSLKSEPSKTYAMPASRLGRVETEAGDEGRPVRDRVIEALVARLFGVAIDEDAGPTVADVSTMLYHAGVDDEIREVGEELAKAAREGGDE